MSDTETTYVMGTVADVAADLYDELLTTGSSVMLDEVVKVIITNIKKYAGWSGQFQDPPASANDSAKPVLSITANTVLGMDDWIITEPVVRAHCDLVQARRMEAAQNLGVQPSGMTSSEALQLYKDAIEVMKKEAFQCQPFSVDMPDIKTPYSFLKNYTTL